MRDSIRNQRRALLVAVLCEVDWNIPKAAKALRLTRQAVYRRMSMYDVQRPEPVSEAYLTAVGSRGARIVNRRRSRGQRKKFARLAALTRWRGSVAARRALKKAG